MSGEKYIKQAIVASLCEHPKAEEYRRRAFSGDNIERVMEAMRDQKLSKADFFALDDDGKPFIDGLGAWKNFDRIVKLVAANGEQFNYDDFVNPVSGARDQQHTLLESARVNGGLAKVFSVEVWKGRYEDMERLWYKVQAPVRKDLFRNGGLLSLDLKRQMFAAEGRVVPEDRLAKAGLRPDDIRHVFSDRGNFEEVSRQLQRAGDYFRKEYALMVDSAGDTVFDNRAAAWEKYEALVKTMHEHGERFEVADFIRQVSFAKNILGRAAEHRVLNKVFTPAHWTGRLPDMVALWSEVRDGWKTAPMTTRDFDNAYAEAESLTHTARFEARTVTGKADLLKALNEPSSVEKPVLPLGLKSVWEKFDAIQSVLQAKGEKLTMTDLRTATGQLGNSCLMSAAKLGHFDKVISVSRKGGEALQLEDFLSKDSHGNTLINVLADRNQLALAFAPDIWAGRVADMKTLWSHVKVAQRQQVNFSQAEIEAKQATLKMKKGNFTLKSKRPKES